MLLVTSLLSIGLTYAVVGGVLFLAAGRTDLPMFWAYLAVLLAVTAAATVAVYRRNPDLIREQRRPATGNQDRLTVPLFLICFLAHWIVAGLDAGRYGWSGSMPAALQLAGLAAFAGGFAVVAWATVANRFYSPAVRLQAERGQEVITGGPYHLVRHPGYLGWIVFGLASGVALGSWVAAAPMLALAALLIRRTVIEDRMLLGGLEGYPAYAQAVRYRLLPGVW
jgi:protein-S-isoprenylcysteine O-methyltransferase Ste14